VAGPRLLRRAFLSYLPLFIAIHQPVFLMKLTEGAVGFHLGNDDVDKDEEIVLPLAHQHTDFSVGERVLDKRCSEAWVILHIPRSLGDFGNHHVSIALSHLVDITKSSAFMLSNTDNGINLFFRKG
jgi:hypothetical protein